MQSIAHICDINIKDVGCPGTETAIFVRDLPEMNIRNIRIENISMQSEKDSYGWKERTSHCGMQLGTAQKGTATQNSKDLVLRVCSFMLVERVLKMFRSGVRR